MKVLFLIISLAVASPVPQLGLLLGAGEHAVEAGAVSAGRAAGGLEHGTEAGMAAGKLGAKAGELGLEAAAGAAKAEKSMGEFGAQLAKDANHVPSPAMGNQVTQAEINAATAAQTASKNQLMKILKEKYIKAGWIDPKTGQLTTVGKVKLGASVLFAGGGTGGTIAIMEKTSKKHS